MKINEKIRTLRENKHWSQEELAEKLNMSLNGYAKIERGENNLTIQKLEKIAQVFGIDILELMSFGESNILLFQEKDNHFFSTFTNNIINTSQDLALEIRQLKQTIQHKDELLTQKDMLIQSLQRENELLRK